MLLAGYFQAVCRLFIVFFEGSRAAASIGDEVVYNGEIFCPSVRLSVVQRRVDGFDNTRLQTENWQVVSETKISSRYESGKVMEIDGEYEREVTSWSIFSGEIEVPVTKDTVCPRGNGFERRGQKDR